MERYGNYNEYSSKLFDTTEDALIGETITRYNYDNAEFEFDNIYIKNKKTYNKILKDLIYLEGVYREKYVRIAFLDEWRTYDKFNTEYEKLFDLYNGNLPLLKKKENDFKQKEIIKFTKKIKALYYYFFVYQMYMEFKFFIDFEWAVEVETDYFYIVDEDDTRYIDLIKESYYNAYESILLFNETNNNDFLNVDKMEKDIDLLLVDCLLVQRYRGEENKFYMLNYLQPFNFKSKGHSIRIRRRGDGNELAIKNRSSYDAIRKRNATRKQNYFIKKYYNEKKINPKLTKKQFLIDNNIPESSFYHYQRKKFNGMK